MDKNVQDFVLSKVKEHTGFNEKIELTDKLTSSIGADSLDLANIIMDIEEEYDIIFPEDVQESLLVSNAGYLIETTERLIKEKK